MNLTIKDLIEDESLIDDFIEFFFDFRLYPYQKKFFIYCLKYNRIAGKWCRQAGKSQTVALYTITKTLLEHNSNIIIVAPTQNQSTELYNKIRDIISNKDNLKILIKKSTESEMKFKNGSRILSLPTGPYGATIRGYTCDTLIIEESGIIKDNIVNTVLIPMIASKGVKGQIIKIGTPLTRNHFYRSVYEDKNYKVVNVTWKDCVEVGQYNEEFVNEQKASLTDIEFRTEYEGEFIDEISSFFPNYVLENAKMEYELIPLQ